MKMDGKSNEKKKRKKILNKMFSLLAANLLVGKIKVLIGFILIQIEYFADVISSKL